MRASADGAAAGAEDPQVAPRTIKVTPMVVRMEMPLAVASQSLGREAPIGRDSPLLGACARGIASEHVGPSLALTPFRGHLVREDVHHGTYTSGVHS